MLILLSKIRKPSNILTEPSVSVLQVERRVQHSISVTPTAPLQASLTSPALSRPAFSHPASRLDNVWTWQRQGLSRKEAGVPVQQGWSAVPSWQNCSVLEEGQVRNSYRCRSSSVPGEASFSCLRWCSVVDHLTSLQQTERQHFHPHSPKLSSAGCSAGVPCC